ncbi:MurR/RpiR family transcriptional regulator [Steroidobacter agaridevorans]|uniref:MurR/RpiR family transcriptional regulator n=1 Tax=Steroidobacter agaridevorans TaxID=2695856 RepID=UPI0013225C69|nr:MurR/RpiR family transcriptional regulator [Steroidobacter agaridevorans]GFE85488.1 transcriptional regulator [Steroidobacter agaridevorans]
MSSLLKIRAERDQMSAIERRIADFMLENAHLLRDYSSQQLADALQISQSSVVKFSQKLGFKGYPDLKYSIGEAVARGSDVPVKATAKSARATVRESLAETLWQSKSRAEEETRLINDAGTLNEIATLLSRAGKVFCIGFGDDGLAAQAFAQRLALLGTLALHHADAVPMTANISSADRGDVLVVFSEQGQHAALNQLCRQFRERQGKIVSVTRHTSNPLRAHADATLLVSAHDERSHVQPLLYQSALQHLLDQIFVLMCDGDRLEQLNTNLEHVQHLLDPKL